MLENLTDEDLNAWRANPVTEIMRDLLSASYRAQKDAACESYWAGNPWPPEEAAALRRMGAMIEDFFESSSDDVRVMMEQLDEYKRDQAD